MANIKLFDTKDLHEEIKKSFQNINYSQWERVKSSDRLKRNSVTNLPTKEIEFRRQQSTKSIDESKCSAFCNHGGNKSRRAIKYGGKTKKQLQKEEENRKLLEVKIQHTKEAIVALKLREIELRENNLALEDFIKSTEKNAHDTVNDTLRKYEKFRNVLTTMVKKHAQEIKGEKEDLERVKKEVGIELPIYENRLKEVNEELSNAQDLYKLLSTYKNQEYPEKLLQIKNLQKQLIDLNNVHEEETAELTSMISKETNRLQNIQFATEKDISDKIMKKFEHEMHNSLKQMDENNDIMEKEKLFHLDMIEKLKKDIEILEAEIKVLLKDDRRQIRKMMFPEFYEKRKICTPDMDVILDI